MLTGIPAWFLTNGREQHGRKVRRIMVGLSLARVALLWVALLYNRNWVVRAVLASVAGAVYVAEYIFVYIQWRLGVRETLERGKKPQMSAENKVLYILAHLSIVNFLLDVCGANVKTLKAQHIIILVGNVVAAIIVVIGYLLVDPYQRAWQCHPPGNRTFADLKYGMCPQWTDFYSPKSTANSGDNNLICRDLSFTAHQTLACTTHVVDTSLPVFWHVATFVLSVTCVRARFWVDFFIVFFLLYFFCGGCL